MTDLKKLRVERYRTRDGQLLWQVISGTRKIILHDDDIEYIYNSTVEVHDEHASTRP